MSLENFMNFSQGLSNVGGFASSVIGGIGSAIQARKNRKLARELAQKQQDFQSSEAEKAFQRNIEMWNKQNAYNSPAAQMARLEAAGLNPNLAYGSLGSSTAGTPPAYNPVSAVQPSDAIYSNPFDSISQMGANLNANALADAQVAQTRANTRNVELQNYRVQLENATLLPAQIQDALNSFAFNKEIRPQTLALGAMQLKQANQSLLNSQKQFDIMQKQLEGLSYENRIKAVDAAIAELTKDKKFESLCAQYQMSIEEGKNYVEKLGYELKTAQYNCQIAFSNMLEESKDNPIRLVERQENENKAQIRKEKLKGQSYTVGDNNTTMGKAVKYVLRYAGFFQSVTDGFGDLVGSFIGRVAGPTLKALKE